jgi:hypothetical protein
MRVVQNRPNKRAIRHGRGAGPARPSYSHVVTQVKPDDDSIRRFIVRHYRYVPERRQRRNVVVAAFDNKREFRRFLRETAAELERRKERGDADPREHVSGVVHEPGHLRKKQNAHLLERATAHGVPASRLADLDLPSYVGLLSSDDGPKSPLRQRWRRRLRRR